MLGAGIEPNKDTFWTTLTIKSFESKERLMRMKEENWDEPIISEAGEAYLAKLRKRYPGKTDSEIRDILDIAQPGLQQHDIWPIF